MGEYPRFASFDIDPAKFCAMIDEFKNHKENDMTPEQNIYRSDVDTVDDVEQDWEGIVDSHYEDDGQPSEYDEWQDYMGGDDWDYGQCDEW